MGRQASLHYVARDKIKGVPHHAKAGNINSAMLKEGPGQGDYILILDSDMLVHPDFLLRTLGHFYEPAKPQSKVCLLMLSPCGTICRLFGRVSALRCAQHAPACQQAACLQNPAFDRMMVLLLILCLSPAAAVMAGDSLLLSAALCMSGSSNTQICMT